MNHNFQICIKLQEIMKRLLSIGLFVAFFALANSALGQTPQLIICKGSSINYQEFNDPGSLPSVAWDWKFAGGTPATSTLRQPAITYPDTGLFYTECTSTFSDGSKKTQGIYVLVIQNTFDPIPMRDTTVCNTAFSINLNAANNYREYHYYWTSSDVNLSGIDTTKRTLNITKPGSYSVKVYSKCGSSTKTITVKQGTKPVVDLGIDKFVCRNAAVVLDAGNTVGNTYLWNTGATSPTITGTTAGLYSVIVTSADGCKSSDQVQLIDSCPPIVYLPSAFTPNDAPPNDIYKPYLEGYAKMSMKIFNRWGQLMFETTDINGGWDGNYMNAPAQEGVYICLLELVGNNTFRKVLKQNFTLLR